MVTKLLLAISIAIGLAGTAQATVFVKSDSPGPAFDGNSWKTAYHTIQQGVTDAQVSMEAVWVARGSYPEKVSVTQAISVYGGFAGTETSLAKRNWTANPTNVNAGGAGTVFRLTADARIDGFTIRNGDYGVFVQSCSPTIINNTIMRCKEYGVYCFAGSPTISDNSFTLNTFCIGCESGAPSVVRNTFTANTEYAVYSISGAPVVTDNTIDGNYGAVYCSDGTLDAERNKILTSTACGFYCCEGVSATIASNLLVGNEEGVRTDAVNPRIINNTIVSSSRYGVFWARISPIVANNIIAFNGTGVARFGGSHILSRNNVYQNGVNYGSSITAANDISADPLFVDSTSGDYHLTPWSPCVNAGTDKAPVIPALDIDGQSRIQGSMIDIGADELAGTGRIATARLWGTNMPAAIENAVVTAWFGDFFYIETDDRSCGMRVASVGGPSYVGQRVNATGTIKLDVDGELYIDAATVQPSGTGTLLPIALKNRDVGGGPSGFQDGVWGWQWNVYSDNTRRYELTQSLHLSNIGLLVTTWGEVTAVGDGYLYIDDGSRLDDGTLTGDGRNIGLRVICDPTGCAPGDYVRVTGVSSCFKDTDGKIRPLVRIAGPQDVVRF